MKDLTPQEIAQQLSISEYTKLCTEVETKYKQKFGIQRIVRRALSIICTIELENNMQQTVII